MRRLYRYAIVGLVTLFVGALALGAVACGDDDEGANGEAPTATSAAAEPTEEDTAVEPGTLPITTLEYRFEAPPSISGGLTAVTLTNPGGEDHQGQLVLLNEGVTVDQLGAALNSDPSGAAALQLVTVAGGTNVVPAGGGTTEVIVDLDPGTYAMLCFVENAEGTPHFALGMLSELEVTEPTEEADLPAPDHSVTATEYEFAPPSAVAPGQTTMQFINSGAEAHELGVVALQEGFTADDLLALFSAPEEPTAAPGEPTPTAGQEGPPPFTSVGGVGAIPPGGSAYWIQNLEAGTYALICFVPNAEGTPHAFLGMVASFTVEE